MIPHAFVIKLISSRKSGGFGLCTAFGTELRPRRELELAVTTFCFLLRRSAFRAKLRAFAKLRSAFYARHFCNFHLAAAIGAESRSRNILLSAARTCNGCCRTAATALWSCTKGV